MVIGGVFGRMLGQALQSFVSSKNSFTGNYNRIGSIDASIYALIGSAAMMSGIISFYRFFTILGFSRITISLCVIIMELTESAELS